MIMTKEERQQAKKALLKAVKLAGSQRKLGAICGITQSHVHNWLYRNLFSGIPVEHVLTIEKALKGTLLRTEMRPDIYPE